MRINKSTVRKTSNRRAHRPDQRIYRTMRLRGVGGRRGGVMRAAVVTALTLVLVLLVVWLIRR